MGQFCGKAVWLKSNLRKPLLMHLRLSINDALLRAG